MLTEFQLKELKRKPFKELTASDITDLINFAQTQFDKERAEREKAKLSSTVILKTKDGFEIDYRPPGYLPGDKYPYVLNVSKYKPYSSNVSNENNTFAEIPSIRSYRFTKFNDLGFAIYEEI